jgi:murein DD-endopeptidase MepM/ murein hydrolase activator NlpD
MEVPDGTDLFQNVDIESDLKEWNRHPDPSASHSQPIGFPLQGGPFLCTQGVGGELTHFLAGNLHAIDFRCPVGTPLLAVGDGEVLEAKDENTLTGIAVGNLFEWNAILIKVDQSEEYEKEGPLFIEYVHIQKSLVKVGDRVRKGQVIGEGGSVGFSPEPHLHFAAYKSHDDTAPTVRVHFQSSLDGTIFLPEAGLYYSDSGAAQKEKIEAPS